MSRSALIVAADPMLVAPAPLVAFVVVDQALIPVFTLPGGDGAHAVDLDCHGRKSVVRVRFRCRDRGLSFLCATVARMRRFCCRR